MKRLLPDGTSRGGGSIPATSSPGLLEVRKLLAKLGDLALIELFVLQPGASDVGRPIDPLDEVLIDTDLRPELLFGTA